MHGRYITNKPFSGIPLKNRKHELALSYLRQVSLILSFLLFTIYYNSDGGIGLVDFESICRMCKSSQNRQTSKVRGSNILKTQLNRKKRRNHWPCSFKKKMYKFNTKVKLSSNIEGNVHSYIASLQFIPAGGNKNKKRQDKKRIHQHSSILCLVFCYLFLCIFISQIIQ